MTDSNPSRPCGQTHPTITDPHAATYCNLQEDHPGPHWSILKGATWEDN